jgi:Zn-dependent metalloprotease
LENITSKQRELLDDLQTRYKLEIRWNPQRGVAAVLKGKIFDWRGEKPEELLHMWINKYGPLIGPTDIRDNYEYTGTTKTKSGNLRIRAMQKFANVPIYGATLLLFANKDRGIYRVQSGFYRDIDTSLSWSIDTVLRIKDPESRIINLLSKRLEEDPEGLEFIKLIKSEKIKFQDWMKARFPLTSPPKLWLYPNQEKLDVVYLVTAYQLIEWLDVAGIPKKSIENANLVIDALTGRIIKEGAIFGMSYTDTTGDGLSTLVDSSGSNIVRPLLIVQDNNGDFFLRNRTNTPEIITYDVNGTTNITDLEAKIQNDANISKDLDGHWNQTTTSCLFNDRRDSQQPETDAHFNAQNAWQFYTNLGWQGFDNGQWGAHCIIRLAAHNGMDANAAFWRYIDNNNKHHGYIRLQDGRCSGGNIEFDFSAGGPAMFAHEYQHAITYFGVQDSNGDPGYLSVYRWHRAIHEGLSDTFAGLRTGIWVMPGIWPNGVTRNAKPFRRIEYPRSTDTDSNGSYCDHYDDRLSASSPYQNSTILSHAAYLAGEGGLHQRTNRPTGAELIPVVGVGKENIAEIIHDAVTQYFDNLSANDYDSTIMIEAAKFILDSAEEITGNKKSCEYVMLRRAFYAVGLYPYDSSGNKLDYGGEACMLPWTISWKHSRPYLGFPALWYKSPDLFINNGNGPEYEAIVGQENKLYARVRNIGDKDLNNVVIRFYFRAYGTNLPQSSTLWKECKDQSGNPCILTIANLPAGSMNFSDENNPPSSQKVDWYLDSSEIVSGIDHFCVRAKIECQADNHDNDCPYEVQSNIQYAQLNFGLTNALSFLVANWEQEDIPLELEITHTLPKGYRIEYVGKEPLKEIRLKPREERKLTFKITTPKHESKIQPPYDGAVSALIIGSSYREKFRGELSNIQVLKPQSRMKIVRLQGTLSGKTGRQQHFSGRFIGDLDPSTGSITGYVNRDSTQIQKDYALHERLNLRGVLEPLRSVSVTQLIRRKVVGGISLKLKPFKRKMKKAR